MLPSSESNQNTNTNHTPSDSPYPDLTSLNRTDLIKSLQEIVRILDVLKQKIAAAQATEDEIKALKKRGREEAEVLPSSWKSPIAICAAVCGGFVEFLICVGDGSFDDWFLGSLILFVIFYFFVKFIASSVVYPIKCPEEVEAKYQVFANEHISPKQALLAQQMEDIDTYLSTEECQWAGNALPEKYFTYPAIQAIIQYLQLCRVDSLKEALNLYEEELHRQRMEEMQQQIVQSTAQAADEAKRQSSVLSDLQKTAKNTNTSVKIGNIINFLKD